MTTPESARIAGDVADERLRLAIAEREAGWLRLDPELRERLINLGVRHTVPRSLGGSDDDYDETCRKNQAIVDAETARFRAITEAARLKTVVVRQEAARVATNSNTQAKSDKSGYWALAIGALIIAALVGAASHGSSRPESGPGSADCAQRLTYLNQTYGAAVGQYISGDDAGAADTEAGFQTAMDSYKADCE